MVTPEAYIHHIYHLAKQYELESRISISVETDYDTRRGDKVTVSIVPDVRYFSVYGNGDGYYYDNTMNIGRLVVINRITHVMYFANETAQLVKRLNEEARANL